MNSLKVSRLWSLPPRISLRGPIAALNESFRSSVLPQSICLLVLRMFLDRPFAKTEKENRVISYPLFALLSFIVGHAGFADAIDKLVGSTAHDVPVESHDIVNKKVS